MRISRTLGLPVLDPVVARQAGAVTDVLVDTHRASIVAFDVSHGDGLLRERVPVECVERVNERALVVPNSDEVALLPPRQWPEGMLGMGRLRGLPVLTAGGDSLGGVADVLFDPVTMDVVQYDLAGSVRDRLLGRTRLLPSEVVACSPEVMVVDREAPGARQTAADRLHSMLTRFRRGEA